MRNFIFLIMLCFGVLACAERDVATLLERHLWRERVLVISAASESDAQLQAQRAALQNKDPLKARKLAVYQVIGNQVVIVNGEYKAQLYPAPFLRHFKLKQDEFAVILIGLDGEEKRRQSTPISEDALFSLIDTMPMRQQELQENPAP